jgi:integrase
MSGLSRYAAHRAAGPLKARFVATTWGQHMSILSLFYRWAIAEGYATAEPFTYRSARALFAGTGREVKVNLAVRRTPKPHVTIKYLEPDFTELFRRGLRGLAPDGSQDSAFHGRELARNAAVGNLALATGLRLQEFTYLLPWEIPALPPEPTTAPIPFPVPSGVTKGRKFRTTWTSYEALASVHDYVELDRAATAEGSRWRPPRRWGEPLMVSEPDARGGRINGVRRPWESLRPSERRRLVAPDGGSCLLAVKNGGGPFTAWSTVFERTSDRIRARFEPRFPHVHAHRLRHSFSIRTLEFLVTGHYRQAAKLIRDTDADAALVFYLTKADPLLVLRDLLGHSTVLTTEKYLRRLDTTRIYREAYEGAGAAAGPTDHAAAGREAAAEFTGDFEDGDV